VPLLSKLNPTWLIAGGLLVGVAHAASQDDATAPDPDIVTELEVRFEPQGPESTRVDLEHRGLEALGDQAQAVRGIFDSPGGWLGLLDRFVGSVT
jgi:hypothetical protein